MSKANEPAYPVDGKKGQYDGLTKREKLAMEIYSQELRGLEIDNCTDHDLSYIAKSSLRAADIFFEQLNDKP